MKKNSIQIYIFKSVVLTLLLISSIILVVNVMQIVNVHIILVVKSCQTLLVLDYFIRQNVLIVLKREDGYLYHLVLKEIMFKFDSLTIQ